MSAFTYVSRVRYAVSLAIYVNSILELTSDTARRHSFVSMSKSVQIVVSLCVTLTETPCVPVRYCGHESADDGFLRFVVGLCR